MGERERRREKEHGGGKIVIRMNRGLRKRRDRDVTCKTVAGSREKRMNQGLGEMYDIHT